MIYFTKGLNMKTPEIYISQPLEVLAVIDSYTLFIIITYIFKEWCEMFTVLSSLNFSPKTG
jgi:hypothetical protein